MVKIYAEKHKEKIKIYSKKWRKNNQLKRKIYSNLYWAKNRLKILAHRTEMRRQKKLNLVQDI